MIWYPKIKPVIIFFVIIIRYFDGVWCLAMALVSFPRMYSGNILEWSWLCYPAFGVHEMNEWGDCFRILRSAWFYSSVGLPLTFGIYGVRKGYSGRKNNSQGILSYLLSSCFTCYSCYSYLVDKSQGKYRQMESILLPKHIILNKWMHFSQSHYNVMSDVPSSFSSSSAYSTP